MKWIEPRTGQTGRIQARQPSEALLSYSTSAQRQTTTTNR
nr:MAG TPA: Putative collagen-binding domain of a collagenase [Caudoviricetes sp.]